MNGDSNPKRDISEIIPPPLCPVTALLDGACVMTRRDEGGNKLDRTALIFHFDEGKVIAAMK